MLRRDRATFERALAPTFIYTVNAQLGRHTPLHSRAAVRQHGCNVELEFEHEQTGCFCALS